MKDLPPALPGSNPSDSPRPLDTQEGSPGGEPSSFSIGRLAEFTGIAVDTLRKWELRYGYPKARRLPSGHRRYGWEEARRLRRISEAIQRGVPVRSAVTASEEGLEGLLAGLILPKPPVEETQAWLGLVRAYDKRGFALALEHAAERLGIDQFLEQALAPWLTELGAQWTRGEVDIRHEHFATEVTIDVLRSLLARYGTADRGPRVVFATLPGEVHVIGLWMGALAAAVAGADTRLLGSNMPLDEIVRASSELNAQAVAVSISLATGGVLTDRRLAALRDLLPSGVQLMAGGDGARGPRRGPRGVVYFERFSRLSNWVSELSSRDDV